MRAEAAGYDSREVPGKGGRGGIRREYALTSLPAETRRALQSRALDSVLSNPPAAADQAADFPTAGAQLPAPAAALCTDLTDRQRLERDARSGVLSALRQLQTDAGCSQETAIATLITSARAGRLDPAIDRMLRLARDPRGRAGDGYPSARTLKRWLGSADLAPKLPRADMAVPAWLPGFLAHYQRPEKPTVESAYRSYCESTDLAGLPSIHQARRWLAKLGTVTRERGRMGPRELKSLRPFVRRDFSLLEPNDVWSADGHTFDAEVQHPLHGRPFRPEITTYVDIATRAAVGWSVDLAESATAVSDAMRHGVERYGIPAIVYVDNGSGYKNAQMAAQAARICDDLAQDSALGLMGRLHATMMHSLPYNSQARGVIERFHKTVWVAGAKELPGFIGREMDREARLAHFRLTRKALKSGGAMPLIPWDIFVRWCDERVAEYNNRPHRSLNRLTPALAWAGFEARGWQPQRLGADELQTLFRPRAMRTVSRGEIRLFNNIYFCRDLEEFHGADAQVAYDIHDPAQVWVYDADGRFLCVADVNGNSRHYFPVPVVEQARQKRAKGRLDRIEVRRDEILAELHGAPAIAAPTSQIVIGGRVIDPAAALAERHPEPAPEPTLAAPDRRRTDRTPAENFADWQALDARITAGESVTEDQQRWHRSYQKSAQYRAQSRRCA